MSPKNVNSSILIKTLLQDGFKFKRQSGSHRIYQKDDKHVSVPYHSKGHAIPDGTLSSLINSAGWNNDDLIRLKLRRK